MPALIEVASETPQAETETWIEDVIETHPTGGETEKEKTVLHPIEGGIGAGKAETETHPIEDVAATLGKRTDRSGVKRTGAAAMMVAGAIEAIRVKLAATEIASARIVREEQRAAPTEVAIETESRTMKRKRRTSVMVVTETGRGTEIDMVIAIRIKAMAGTGIGIGMVTVAEMGAGTGTVAEMAIVIVIATRMAIAMETKTEAEAR